MSKPTAVITGATGLVGRELVKLLLSEKYYEKIRIIVRREYPVSDKRVEVHVIPSFESLRYHKELFDAEDHYCCLGTTMEQAGSKEMFRKIDLEYPLMHAALAKGHASFEQFLVVTAVGADSDSPLFYNQVKGEIEDRLIDLNMRALNIFRPSLLLGHRDEFRWKEEIAKVATAVLEFFVVGAKKRNKTIKGSDVALAMLRVARWNEPGIQTFNPAEIIKIAN